MVCLIRTLTLYRPVLITVTIKCNAVSALRSSVKRTNFATKRVLKMLNSRDSKMVVIFFPISSVGSLSRI